VDAALLKEIPLFGWLSKRQRTKLAQHIREVELAPGEHLVDEGESAYQFFVIREGHAAVISGGRHLRDLGPGDFLGEIGLVQHRDRTASVIASSRIKALVMEEEDFQAMARSMPTVAEQLDAAIEERLARDRLFGLER
jgi:CRP-like cAMP-binding protein